MFGDVHAMCVVCEDGLQIECPQKNTKLQINSLIALSIEMSLWITKSGK